MAALILCYIMQQHSERARDLYTSLDSIFYDSDLAYILGLYILEQCIESHGILCNPVHLHFVYL